MKQYLLHITIVFIAIVSFSCSNNTGSEAPSKSIDTIPALIMQVKQTSRLYTAEYNIRKIVTHDDVIRLKGTLFNKDFDMPVPIGDRKIAIPMNAKLKAYIDFSEFSEKNIERNGNKITIILPDPRVTLTDSKIDQKNIKEFVSLTRSYFSDAEMSDYERQGRASIIASIPQLGIIETARENAARVLIPMVEQMGFGEKDITVTYRKQFGNGDINTLIDKQNIETNTSTATSIKK